MKNVSLIVISSFIFLTGNLSAQSPRFVKDSLEPVLVYMSVEKLEGKTVLKLVKDSTVKEADEPSFVKIKGVHFRNGIIEVKVLSKLLKNAPDYARGFIGVAFRISDSNSRYESIYLRPVNARVDDQVRRNHSIQYYSYPDYKFDRLRKESPERYESYADIEMNTWITMRIEVSGAQAKLFLNGNKQPSLVVNDLKHGPDASGGIGLWTEVGTEAYFSELRIQQK